MVVGQTRDSAACDAAGASNGTKFSGAHWPIPQDRAARGFADSNWPRGTTYTNTTVGVDNEPAYTNFTAIFDTPGADARLIGSSNLILDNLVLVRKTFD